MSKTIYISGKIGEEVISVATRQKFARAEEMLRAKGFDVFNPCDERWQECLKEGYGHQYFDRERTERADSVPLYDYCLLRDLMVLSLKDAVYFLDDWRKSHGAATEYCFALATGKRMCFQDYGDSMGYLAERMYREAKEAGKPIETTSLRRRCDIEIAYFKKHLDEAWLPIDLNGKEGGV